MHFPIFRGTLLRWLVLLILGFTFFQICHYLYLLKEDTSMKKYVRDYEKVLCGFIDFKNKAEKSKNTCPKKGIITSFRQGTFSNVMWQYANVLYASNVTGLDGFIPGCTKDVLEEVFADIGVPLLSEIGHCDVPLPESAASLGDWMDLKQSIVIRTNDLFGASVMTYLNVVCKHFQFTAPMKNLAREYLLAAKPNGTENATYVGAYIKKTNIIVNQEVDDMYPNVQFFVDAIRRFRDEYPNAVFVVITDLTSFWQYVFGNENVHVIDEETLTHFGSSLAILAHCNHTILSSDDFAVWAAILSGGKAIVSLCLAENFNALVEHQKNWNYILNTSNSSFKDGGPGFESILWSGWCPAIPIVNLSNRHFGRPHRLTIARSHLPNLPLPKK